MKILKKEPLFFAALVILSAIWGCGKKSKNSEPARLSSATINYMKADQKYGALDFKYKNLHGQSYNSSTDPWLYVHAIEYLKKPESTLNIIARKTENESLYVTLKLDQTRYSLKTGLERVECSQDSKTGCDLQMHLLQQERDPLGNIVDRQFLATEHLGPTSASKIDRCVVSFTATPSEKWAHMVPASPQGQILDQEQEYFTDSSIDVSTGESKLEMTCFSDKKIIMKADVVIGAAKK